MEDRTPGGIILPGLPQKPTLARIVDAHNLAIASLSPSQKQAVNRLLLATMTACQMTNFQGTAEDMAAAGQAAMAAVIQKETDGAKLLSPMWSVTPTLQEAREGREG